jgi:hypothetical protein
MLQNCRMEAGLRLHTPSAGVESQQEQNHGNRSAGEAGCYKFGR